MTRTFGRTTRHALTRRAVLAITALAAMLTVEPAEAADWPTRPVKIIYNYPAGTGGDVVLRAVAERLTQKLGQPFVVENRGGAAGTVGVESAVRSTPDGYTFLGSPNAPLVLLPQLRKVNYDPKELKPIVALGEYIYGWAVMPSLGVKSVAELVAMAKAKPGALTFSSPGVGSATHLRGMALNHMAGMDITHVPYRGGPDALNDFLAGNVAVMLDNAHFPQVRAGKAMMLAVTTTRRHPDFPDVPTMAEAGYDLGLPTLLALYAIKGTPDDIAAKFGAAVAEITALPEVKRRLLDIGFFPMSEQGDEITKLNARGEVSFTEWIKKVNFKLSRGQSRDGGTGTCAADIDKALRRKGPILLRKSASSSFLS
jgi:tripartite-type tricarboxylate transporter receptor subunit TctC